MPPVLIIGGGIAGLATAYELHRRNIQFRLFEASARPGGVILSERIDGFTVDGGPDALLVQKPEGIALCHELGLGERLIPTQPPRLAFIQRRGVLHPLPTSSVLGIPTRIGPFIRTSLFSWPAKLRMGTEVFMSPRGGDALEDESIGAFMRRHFGDEATDYLAEPLLAGIHAGDVDRLSIAALFPRFTEAERRHGSLLRAFRKSATRPAADGAFRSLPGGLSEMITALMAALPADSVRLQTPVDRVVTTRSSDTTPSPAVFRVVTSAGESFESPAVVITAPAYATSRIVRDLDADLATLSGEINYVSTATIAMAFARSAIGHPLHGSGFVVPRVENTGILAASWLSSKWAHRAPEGKALLRVFVGGARDPRALERSDSELVERSFDAIRPVLAVTGAPLFTRVYRWERASAQHDVGHLARMRRIEHTLERHPGLFITGSGFRGVGIPDCVADGRATAGKVAQFLS